MHPVIETDRLILRQPQLGVPIQKIIVTHLGYGKYLSLKAFINKSMEIT